MISEGVLNMPAPLLTRVYQSLGNGMVKYHEALKFPDVPVPFPYVATAELLLFFHSALTPFVSVEWSAWGYQPPIFTFFFVFTLRALHVVAGELENPFEGTDANDLDMAQLQQSINAHLLCLVRGPSLTLPKLVNSSTRAARRLEVQARFKAKCNFSSLGLNEFDFNFQDDADTLYDPDSPRVSGTLANFSDRSSREFSRSSSANDTSLPSSRPTVRVIHPTKSSLRSNNEQQGLQWELEEPCIFRKQSGRRQANRSATRQRGSRIPWIPVAKSNVRVSTNPIADTSVNDVDRLANTRVNWRSSMRHKTPINLGVAEPSVILESHEEGLELDVDVAPDLHLSLETHDEKSLEVVRQTSVLPCLALANHWDPTPPDNSDEVVTEFAV